MQYDYEMRERGETTLLQCVTDNFLHELDEDSDSCSVCGMGPYTPEEIRNYNQNGEV